MKYDYYSLGVVLLYIGAWTEKRNMSIRELREQPQHRYFQKLRGHVGQQFTNAVRVCLDGLLDRYDELSPEERNQAVLPKFTDKIVEPLRKLSALYS
jgi:hypothetical protein